MIYRVKQWVNKLHLPWKHGGVTTEMVTDKGFVLGKVVSFTNISAGFFGRQIEPNKL